MTKNLRHLPYDQIDEVVPRDRPSRTHLEAYLGGGQEYPQNLDSAAIALPYQNATGKSFKIPQIFTAKKGSKMNILSKTKSKAAKKNSEMVAKGMA